MIAKISIRWRIQIWQTLLLSVIVTLLVVFLYQKEKERSQYEVDRDLGQRVVDMMRLLPHVKQMHGTPETKRDSANQGGRRGRAHPKGGRRPRHGGEGRPKPGRGADRHGERSIPEGARNSREVNEETIKNPDYYVAVWTKNKLSLNVRFPEGRVAPDFTPSPAGVYQTRGNYREVIGGAPSENKVLIGYNMEKMNQELAALAWSLSGGGVCIVIVGFILGWLATGWAVKPISEINEVASEIADGKLAERIDIKRPSKEIASLQRELNQTFSALEKAMEHQKKFTSDASHELRNPLAAMMLEIEVTLASGVDDDETRESLYVCKRNLTEMSSMVQGLLALARLDEGQVEAGPEIAAVDEIILETVERLQPMAEEAGVEIHTELEPMKVEIVTAHVHQIVDNLLTNALKYGKAGKKVIVALSGNKDTGIEIVVQDFGAGIAAEDLDEIFERFYRADTARPQQDGSSGIGLAIVKGFVESSGGSISVTSEVGEGATFRVKLPC